MKNEQNKNELSNKELHQLADEQKRAFMKKFGNFAKTAPVGMFLLMSLGSSKAHAGSSSMHSDLAD